jgi:hypothetical protein
VTIYGLSSVPGWSGFGDQKDTNSLLGILGAGLGSGSSAWVGVGAGFPGALQGGGSSAVLGAALVVGILAFLTGLALRVSRLR